MRELITASSAIVVAIIGVIGSIALKLLGENRAQHGQGLAASQDVKQAVLEVAAEMRTGQQQIRRDLSTLSERVDHNQQLAEQRRAEILTQVSRRRATDTPTTEETP